MTKGLVRLMNKKVVSAVAFTLLVSASAFAAGGAGIKPAASKAVPSKAPVKAQAAAPVLKTAKDKVSYIIGYSVGNNLHRNEANAAEINLTALQTGIRAALAGQKPALNDTEIQQVMGEFQQKLMTRKIARVKAEGAKNLKEGEEFLAANKKKSGVVTLASGLQYKELKAGTGKTPTLTDMVTVNYRGTLINGKEFDSSYKRGEPATFPVNGIIPGWTEALQKMREGSKWQLFIPAKLAYGEQGAGSEIGPNSTLIFEVELLAVAPRPNPAAAPTTPEKSEQSAQPAEKPAQPAEKPAQPAEQPAQPEK